MLFRRVSVCAAISVVVMVGHVPSSQAERKLNVVPAEFELEHILVSVGEQVHDYIVWIEEQERLVAEYVASVVEQQRQAAAAAAVAAAAVARVQSVVVSAGAGYPSEAFWHKVAVCEEGGQNHPYFGYFGKIDGAWAGLSWDEQVRRARELWAANASHISTVWTSVPSCTGPPF